MLGRIITALVMRLYPHIAFRKTRHGKILRALPLTALTNPECISLGNDCYIGPGCRIEAWCEYGENTFSPRIILGDEVKINSRCHISAIDRVEIGDQCLLGANVLITDHAHGNGSLAESGVHPTKRPLHSKGPVKIGPRVWLCENVVILPGVTVGESSVIGANAVVTKNIPSFSVAVGNPAHVVKKIRNIN